MPPTITLASVALDCADPVWLGEFYRDLLGYTVAYSSPEFVGLTGGPIWLALVRVDDYRPPIWPGSTMPKQMHIDLSTDDLDAASDRAVELGATLTDFQPAPDRWRVLLDPAGHPFCFSAQIPEL